jgi:DNA-binding SARP family transcriptional activator
VRYRLLTGVEVSGRRAWSPLERSLLTVLMLGRNRSISVDAIIDLLWGDNAPPDARGSLQSKISRLRRVPGLELLRFQSGSYLLSIATEDCDVDRFELLSSEVLSPSGETKARLEAADRALELWQGNRFIASTAITNVDSGLGSSYLAEGVRLEALRDSVAVERLAILWALGDDSRLVSDAAAVAIECPYSDRVCELQMRGLARSGRTVEALRAFTQYRTRLDEEVGVTPSSALTALEAQLLQELNQPTPKPLTVDTATVKPVTRQPATPQRANRYVWSGPLVHRPEFVGRESAIATLRRAVLHRVGAAMIWGEPGAGKSRLVGEVITTARQLDIDVTVIRCPPPPAAMFAGIDRALARLGATDSDRGPSEAQRVNADEVRQTEGPIDATTSRGEAVANRTAQLLRTVRSVEEVSTRSGPPEHLVVVDDLHWADEGTLECVQGLADSIELDYCRSTSVLVASRPLVEVGASQMPNVERLLRTLGPVSLSLDQLTEPELAHVLARSAGEPVAAHLTSALHVQCGGNPLLALSEFAALRASGLLVRRNDRIDVDHDQTRFATSRLPGDLTDCLDRVLATLTEDARDRVTSLALEADGGSRLSSDEGLQALIDLGILNVRDGYTSFTHHAYRQVVLHDVSADRRRTIHRDIAIRLINNMRADKRDESWPNELLLSAAHHVIEAGLHLSAGNDSDADLPTVKRDILKRCCFILHDAGRRHLALTGWEHAAVVLGHGASIADHLRQDGFIGSTDFLELQLDLALARFHNHDAAGAAPALDLILASDAPIALRATAIAISLRSQLTMNQQMIRLDARSIESTLAECEESAPVQGARLLGLLAESSAINGDADTAASHSERAVRMARHSDLVNIQAETEFASGLTAMTSLDIAEAEQRFRTSERLAAKGSSQWTRGWSIGRLAYLSYLTDPATQAWAELEQARRHHVSVMAWAELSVIAATQAAWADLHGDLEQATAYSAEAERLMRRSGYPYTAPMLFAGRLRRAGAQKDLSSAAATIEDWKSYVGRVPPIASTYCNLLGEHSAIDSRSSTPLRGIGAGRLHAGHLHLVDLYQCVGEALGDTDLQHDTETHLNTLVELGIRRLPGAARLIEAGP